MSNSAAGGAGPDPTRRRDRPEFWILAPMIVLGTIGAAVGLIIGLVTYWQTSLFAMVEVGIPAAILGSVIGMIGLGMSKLVARRRRSPSVNHP